MMPGTFDRLPQTGGKGIYLKQQVKHKLIEHKHYIDKYGEDLPEIRDWTWSPRGMLPGNDQKRTERKS